MPGLGDDHTMVSRFPRELRRWRTARGLSQLELAVPLPLRSDVLDVAVPLELGSADGVLWLITTLTSSPSPPT
jgi:hypothetical protein